MSYGVDASIDVEAEKMTGGRARVHDGRGYTPDNAEASLAGEDRHHVEIPAENDEAAFEAVFENAIREYNDAQALKYGRPAKGRCTGIVRDVTDPETGEVKRVKLGKKALDRMYPEAGGVGYRVARDGETGGDERVPDGYPPGKDGRPLMRYIDRVRADGRDLTQMEEIVLGVGSREDGLGITDRDFDVAEWTLAKERDGLTGGHEAADYVAAHRTPERVAELGRARAALEDVRDRWKERFPNLKLLRFDIHMDEPDGSPHAHAVYVPVALRNKNGPAMQCSLEGALREMGFKEGKKGARGGAQALADLREAQRRLVYDCAKGHGLDVTMSKGKGGRRRVGKKDIAKTEALAAETYSAALAEAGATIAEMHEMDALEAAYLRHKTVADAEQEAETAKAEAATAKAERDVAKAAAKAARAEVDAAKSEKAVAEAAVKAAKQEAAQAVAERDRAKGVRDLYAGESYRTKDGRTALGTKGLIAENKRLRAENERLERDNAAKWAEGARIDAENAGRAKALDERERTLKAGEEQLAEDRAKLDDDRAEVSRLLDGHNREATEEDYLDSTYGDRIIAEFYAHKHFWADYHENGGKPKTIHEPGLRETVKAAKEARQGYEAAAEEARRERDGLREFREGLVALLEDLCKSVKMAQKEEDNKGHKATARFFRAVHGVFAEALKTLDDAHVPEEPVFDRAAWDEALSAAKTEQARAEVRAHATATATARISAPGVPREVPGAGPRPSKPSGHDGPSL